MNPIFAMFEQQVKLRPDAIAVYCGKQSVTYRQLQARAEQLRRLIPGRPGQLVSIELDRTEDFIAAMLAVLGGEMAYLPIASDCPQERKDFMLQDGNVFYRLIQGESGPLAVPAPDYDKDGGMYSETAYVVYTSGSTGRPKGMPILNSSVCNFIQGFCKRLPVCEGQTIACLTTVSFDIFFIESILPLCVGMTVAMAREDEQASPGKIAGLLKRYSVDVMQAIPSRLQILLYRDGSLACLKGLDVLMIGGEPLPLSLLQTLQTNTGARLFNLYGPTETTLWATAAELTNAREVTLGTPFDGYRVFVADGDLTPVSAGETGQICIQGPGLTPGYRNRPEQMNAHFSTGPDGEPVYLTGDLARVGPDGALVFAGRMDNQVKIRGNRVELEEIEACAMQVPGVVQAVAGIYEKDADKHLCLFYMAGEEVEQAAIAAALKNKLPGYMIPSAWQRVADFPRLPNGKVDRSGIVYQPQGQEPIQENDPLRETVKSVLAECGCSVSALDDRKSLPELGLDSVSFVRMVVELEEAFDFEFDDAKMSFDALPTLGALIEYLSCAAGQEVHS